VNQGDSQADCNRGFQAMVAGALGVARTDPEGLAQTGALPTGANAVTLEPRNGSASH